MHTILKERRKKDMPLIRRIMGKFKRFLSRSVYTIIEFPVHCLAPLTAFACLMTIGSKRLEIER